MNRFELKAARHLSVSDVLELAEDVRLFRIMRIDAAADGGRRKFHMQSLDGHTRLMLIRESKDLVRVAVRH